MVEHGLVWSVDARHAQHLRDRQLLQSHWHAHTHARASSLTRGSSSGRSGNRQDRSTEADRGRQRPDSCQPTEPRQSPDRAPTEPRQSPTEPDRPTAMAQLAHNPQLGPREREVVARG